MERSEYTTSMNAAVFVVQNTCLRLIEEVSLRHGRISLSQMRLLSYLKSIGASARVSDVARETDQSISVVSKAADALVRKGLAERTTPLDDRRIVLLAPTGKGLALCDSIGAKVVSTSLEYHTKFIDKQLEVGEGMSPRELERLREVVTEYYEDLSAAIESFSLKERHLRKRLAGTMSPNAFYVLLTLAIKDDAPTASYLARYLCMSKAIVSSCVSELVRGQYVTAQRSPEDRRKSCLTLTKRGREFTDRSVDLLDELFGLGYAFDDEAIRLILKSTDLRCSSQRRAYPATT